MTWKGTDHIHCCTQIINPGEEKKKKKKKEKQLSHRLGSHARTRAQRNRGAHGARRTRRPPPREKKKGPKQTGRGGARLLALAGLDADAWCGVDEAAAPRRAAPRPQAVNTAAGVHVLILLYAVRAEQRQTMCCGEQAGSPVQTNAGCISSSHRRCGGGSPSSGWRCFY